jgi:hypothetical protein
VRLTLDEMKHDGDKWETRGEVAVEKVNFYDIFLNCLFYINLFCRKCCKLDIIQRQGRVTKSILNLEIYVGLMSLPVCPSS